MEKESRKIIKTMKESSGIFISIKPKFTCLIENGEKNYEFRKYIPKNKINVMYVYESSPSSCLKYILIIDRIVKYPDVIEESGFGNYEFNSGLKNSKYAYHIQNVYKLVNPISLIELKKKFNFFPPQSYAYDRNNPKLVEYINSLLKEKII